MIYLDNSATTRVFPEAAEAAARAMQEEYFNPAAIYAPGMNADLALRPVRESIAAALGDRTMQVTFTASGTEGDNQAFSGLLPSLKGKKGHFITTGMEHAAVLKTADALREAGHRVDILDVSDGGRVRLEELESLLDEETSLVSVMQVNNESGVMQDLAAMGELIRAKAPNALFHLDGVQGFLRVPISMPAVKADLYSLSGHKVHAPKGVGALVMNARAERKLSPILYGGGQENGLRSGTLNTPGIRGLGASVAAFAAHGDEWRAHLMAMKLRLWKNLTDTLEGVLVNGPDPAEAAPHILNLSFDGARGEVLLHAMEGEGVLISTGSACSSKGRKVSRVLMAQGVSAERAEEAVRISLGVFNTEEEMDRAAEIFRAQVLRLRRFKRR